VQLETARDRQQACHGLFFGRLQAGFGRVDRMMVGTATALAAASGPTGAATTDNRLVTTVDEVNIVAAQQRVHPTWGTCRVFQAFSGLEAASVKVVLSRPSPKREKTGETIFYDCSAESPKGRRRVCYDREGQESRKEHKPEVTTRSSCITTVRPRTMPPGISVAR